MCIYNTLLPRYVRFVPDSARVAHEFHVHVRHLLRLGVRVHTGPSWTVILHLRRRLATAVYGCVRRGTLPRGKERKEKEKNLIIGPCYKEEITRIVTNCIFEKVRFPRAGRRVCVLCVCVCMYMCVLSGDSCKMACTPWENTGNVVHTRARGEKKKWKDREKEYID